MFKFGGWELYETFEEFPFCVVIRKKGVISKAYLIHENGLIGEVTRKISIPDSWSFVDIT